MAPTTSKPSQPGMMGGAVGRPVSWSMGPGSDTPAAHTACSSGAAMSRSCSAAFARVAVGPREMGQASIRRFTGVPARSVTARCRVEVCTPVTSTRPSSCRKRQVSGARPPVEGPAPLGQTSPSSTAVLSSVETVLRPMPVARASCWRVRPAPVRTWSATVMTSRPAEERGSNMGLLPGERPWRRARPHPTPMAVGPCASSPYPDGRGAGRRARGPREAAPSSATPLSVCYASSPSATSLFPVQWRVKRRSKGRRA